MKRTLLVVLCLAAPSWAQNPALEAGAVAYKAASPAQLTANQNDYAGCNATPNVAICRLGVDTTLRRITGFAGGYDGRVLVILNTQNPDPRVQAHITLMDASQDTGSAAANRILLPEGRNCLIEPNGVVQLIYDGTTQAWRLLTGECLSSDPAKIQERTLNPCFSADSSSWDFQSSGTGATLNTFVSGQQECFINGVVGTTTTGRASITDALATTHFGAAVWNFKGVLITPSALSDGTDTYTIRSGAIDSVSAEPTDGCYFRYVHSTNSGRWQGVCRNNSSESVCDTGITVATTTAYVLDMTVTATGSGANFSVEQGTTVSTSCNVASNIPTTSARTFGWGQSILKSAGTTSRTVIFGSMRVRMEAGSPM